MNEDQIDKAIDTIYARLDNLLLAGEFEVVGDILDGVDLNQPTGILLSYLTITFAAKKHLGWHRAGFVERVRNILTERDSGRVESVEALLSGLE